VPVVACCLHWCASTWPGLLCSKSIPSSTCLLHRREPGTTDGVVMWVLHAPLVGPRFRGLFEEGGRRRWPPPRHALPYGWAAAPLARSGSRWAAIRIPPRVCIWVVWTAVEVLHHCVWISFQALSGIPLVQRRGACWTGGDESVPCSNDPDSSYVHTGASRLLLGDIGWFLRENYYFRGSYNKEPVHFSVTVTGFSINIANLIFLSFQWWL